MLSSFACVGPNKRNGDAALAALGRGRRGPSRPLAPTRWSRRAGAAWWWRSSTSATSSICSRAQRGVTSGGPRVGVAQAGAHNVDRQAARARRRGPGGRSGRPRRAGCVPPGRAGGRRGGQRKTAARRAPPSTSSSSSRAGPGAGQLRVSDDTELARVATWVAPSTSRRRPRWRAGATGRSARRRTTCPSPG